MAAQQKILWVVNYHKLEDFLDRAQRVGATGVAIRTDNDVAKAIQPFHDKNIRVYGWRWPSAKRDPAMKEAEGVADLLQQGLDGYFVDPEGAPGKPFDWNQPGLDDLAAEFCSTITGAAANKLFGTTSHYRAKSVFPRLPWATFFRHSDVLLPQSYWRSSDGTIGHGIPADNYRVGLQAWQDAGGDRAKIVPMAGELAQVTDDEIAEHVAEADRQGISTLHFYTYEDGVDDTVWDAISRA
jgi:hypothetical protein